MGKKSLIIFINRMLRQRGSGYESLHQFSVQIVTSHAEISREFGLVMITEYMTESMVLLRRKMCWDLADVLFASINVRFVTFAQIV